MSFFRQLWHLCMHNARAQAQWELDISTSVLKSRKGLIVLGLFTLPAIIGGIAIAGDFLGGKEAYSPSFYTNTIFFASIFVGMTAGLITGCIGAGGGFIIAPALMSAGVKGILAVGTDLFHIFAKAIMGSVLHKKLGNVSVSLAGIFLIGSIAGATAGGWLNRAIYEYNPVLSDLFITTIYTLILGFLAFYAMLDYLRARAAGSDDGAHGGGKEGEAIAPLGKKLQSINIPPMITFDEGVTPGGRRISAIFLIICGAFVGMAAAVMGVGGGFITFPAFVYVLGVSSMTTVGTDIFQIIFTAGYAAISQYACYGFIFYTLAMGMLLGSLLGVQIGALVTKLVPGIYIRGFYALAVTAGFVNRFTAMPSKLRQMEYLDWTKGTTTLIETIGIWLFFICIGAFAVWVIGIFFARVGKLKEETHS